MQQQRLE